MNRSFTICSLAICGLLFIANLAKAQTFIFPPATTDNNCYDGSNYTLQSGLKITGVKVVQVYSDNGTTGSFAFEMIFTYGNIFTGTVGTGSSNFYTYTASFYTDNASISSNVITNNGSNIPLLTDTIGNMNLHNNPTYNGSASALGLVVGTYTNQDTINLFGYDSASLVAQAPCLNLSAGANSNVGGTPLANQFSLLKSSIQGTVIHLDWTTLMEDNNAGFRIERSADGSSWHEITWVHPQSKDGHSDLPLSYSVEDKSPLNGINFYRFIQVDRNGKEAFSNITKEQINPGADITLYPNPSKDLIYIRSNVAWINEPIVLLNLLGQKVFEGSATGNEFHIPTKGLANGTYLIQVANKKMKAIISR